MTLSGLATNCRKSSWEKLCICNQDQCSSKKRRSLNINRKKQTVNSLKTWSIKALVLMELKAVWSSSSSISLSDLSVDRDMVKSCLYKNGNQQNIMCPQSQHCCNGVIKCSNKHICYQVSFNRNNALQQVKDLCV